MEENNEIETIESLKQELILKLNEEMSEYRQDLLQEDPKIIIESAYKITVKQEILDYLTYDKFYTTEELNALLNGKDILEQAYDEWISCDGNLREVLEYPTDETVDLIVKDYKEEKENSNKNKQVR